MHTTATSSVIPTISSILAQHGPAVGVQARAVQGAYADYVQKGLACARENDNGQLFAEAETGTGKTLGYLVAALMDCAVHGSRAIVATHTKALQRQILARNQDGTMSAHCDMAKAIAIVQAQTGKRLSAALRLGRRNFVDDVRAGRVVKALLDNPKLSEEGRESLLAFQDWFEANPGGEFRDYLEAAELDALPEGLQAEDVCISTSTDKKGDAYLAYAAHTQDSREADIVVTNHALLVANAMSFGGLLHAGDRQLGAIIVDECDRLESAAREATSDLLPLQEFRSAVLRWNALHDDGQGTPVLRAIEKTIAFMEGLHSQYAQGGGGGETVVFWEDMPRDTCQKMFVHMKEIHTAIKPVLALHKQETDPDFAEIKDVQEYGQEFMGLFAEVIANERTDVLALRWSPTRHYPSLRRFRLYPARVLKRMWSVWTRMEKDDQDKADKTEETWVELSPEEQALRERMRARALVLTSATVSTPDSTGQLNIVELSNVYGIFAPKNPCHHLHNSGAVFAPKRFGHVKFVFSHTQAPRPFLDAGGDEDLEDHEGEIMRPINPQWVDYTVKGVKAALQQGGRVLVLTNSYRATAPIAQALRDAGLAPIEKTRGNTADFCRRQLVAQPQGVLVTPGAWEGFDLSGEIGSDGQPAKIKHVIITQLPYSRPDGPFQKAMKKFLMQTRGLPEYRAESIVFGQIRSAALRRFKQGFGRGIRSAADSFTLWLTDPRAPRSVCAQNALPPGENRNQQFLYAIPVRFRKSNSGEDPWSTGSVLNPDGTILTDEQMRELEEV